MLERRTIKERAYFSQPMPPESGLCSRVFLINAAKDSCHFAAKRHQSAFKALSECWRTAVRPHFVLIANRCPFAISFAGGRASETEQQTKKGFRIKP